MDKNYLLETAKKLKQVSDLSIQEYTKKQELFIMQINNQMLERADLESLIGKNNTSIMQDNHANHVRFITSILKNNNSDVLVETVLWVFRSYRSHGFSSNYWAAQLNAWIQILKNELSSEAYNEVFPLYRWMQINIPIFVKVSDEKLDNQNSLH